MCIFLPKNNFDRLKISITQLIKSVSAIIPYCTCVWRRIFIFKSSFESIIWWCYFEFDWLIVKFSRRKEHETSNGCSWKGYGSILTIAYVPNTRSSEIKARSYGIFFSWTFDLLFINSSIDIYCLEFIPRHIK